MNEEIEQAVRSATKVSRTISKIYTLFDLEDLDAREGMSVLLTCAAETIFTGGDKDKHEENLALAIIALKHMYNVFKEELLDENKTSET